MKYKNLPAILALSAGFIVCIATFIYRYGGTSWLWLVIGAMVLFYGLGVCLRKLFNVILSDEVTDGEETEGTADEDMEEKAE